MLREPTRKDPLSADWGRDVVREVRRNRVAAGHGLRLVSTADGMILSLAEHAPAPAAPVRGWPYGAQYAFGLTIAQAVVTVHPGALEAAGAAHLCAETAITIASSGQYIGLALDRSAGTLTVTGPHASRPASSGDVYRTALYVMGLDAGGAAYMIRECINDIRLEVGL